MGDPANLISDLSSLIEAADKLISALQAGEEIHLEGLNHEVSRLCTVIEAYPERADEQVKDCFIILRSKLDHLSGSLIQRRDALKSEAEKLAQLRQAINAYESQKTDPSPDG